MLLLLRLFDYMDTVMPIHFLWSEVERLMDIRGIAHRDKLAELTGIHRSNLHKLSKGIIFSILQICNIKNNIVK